MLVASHLDNDGHFVSFLFLDLLYFQYDRPLPTLPIGS